MAVVAKLVNASDCGSDIRGFEPRRSPHSKIKELRFLFFVFRINARANENAYIMRGIQFSHKIDVNIYIQ